MSKAIEAISSEFVVVIGDDDFLIEASVHQCAKFLLENADYAVADGREIRWLVNAEQQSFTSYVLPQLDIEHEKPHHRLQAHLEKYWPTFYGVHRRKNIIGLASIVESFEIKGSFSGLVIQELCLSALVIASGKYKFLDGLYIVRQNDHKSSTKILSWESLIVDSGFQAVSEKLRRCLSAECVKHGSFSRFHADDAFNVGLGVFLKPFPPVDPSAQTYLARPCLFEKTDLLINSLIRSLNSFQQTLFGRVLVAFNFLGRLVVRGAMIGGAVNSCLPFSNKIEDQNSSRYFSIEELSSPELKFHNEIKIILEYIEKYPLGKS